MLRYLSLRVLYTLPVVWLVVSLVFLLIHLVPGDPIQQMLGEGAPAADVQAARHAYGLDLTLCRHSALLASSFWFGCVCSPRVARDHYGRSVGRDPHPHGTDFNARRVGPRLRSHRPRQRTPRAHGRLPPRPAQRDDSHYYRAGATVRRTAGWSDRYRDYFFLARHRLVDYPGDLQS